MCRRIQCQQCQKPTFAGCGKHVEQVLRGVPDEGRCHCKDAQIGGANRAAQQPRAAAPAA